MGYDDDPYIVGSAPCLHLRQHGFYGLGFGVVPVGFHLHEQVWVDNEIFQWKGAPHHVRFRDDIVGSGGYFMQVEVHHVAIQETDDRLQLFLGIIYSVHFSQHELHEMGDMLVFVGHFEREVAYIASGLGHEPAREVVQKIGLSAVGYSGLDNQASLIGGVEYMVGQGAVTYVVSVVVFSVQHVQNPVCTFAYGDDVHCVLWSGGFDDFVYDFDAVCGEYVGNVLAVAG